MLLGVNIDHIATLRNARNGSEPSVIEAAKVCLKAGANGITAHLREDRRHIKDIDIYALRKDINCRLNMEMAATEEMQKIALDLLPDSCCIVPEKRREITTEGGLDVANNPEYIKNFILPLINNGINVSLFIDPYENQIEAAYKSCAKYIELHTGSYSSAFGTDLEESEFQKLKKSAQLAQSFGIKVNAGHGLNYDNVKRMHQISGLHELNIGHSIISKSVFIGLENAVKDMLLLVNKI